MDLHPEEPDLGPWRASTSAELLALVGRPSLVLVDGRGGGGKTTFSSRLAGLLGAGLVHTDDSPGSTPGSGGTTCSSAA